MLKYFISPLLAVSFLAGTAFTDENTAIGIVNFTNCVTDSKFGKKEQENMETLRSQMASMVEETEKELKEISSKLEDTDYLDSLSPQKEEELKVKYQTLQEDLNRYQQQFYQMLQHANYQIIQKLNGNVTHAAEKIAKQQGLQYVINKEACFYVDPNLDVTANVVQEMDKLFDLEAKKQKLSDNDLSLEALDASDLN